MLLKKYIEFGKKVANWIIMTLEDASPVKDESLLKRGFKLKERSFFLEV